MKQKICIVLLLSFSIARASDIFIAHLSDAWYPQNKEELQKTLESLDQQAQQKYGQSMQQSVKAALVPHAGYAYSGAVAAATYRSMKPKKKFIVLATNHYTSMQFVALPPFSEYRTPLGLLSVDQQVIKELSRNELFRWSSKPFEYDHSLEVQLPFIQFYFPHAQIIPLFVGQLSLEQLYDVAQELARFVDAQTGVIVSSDLTHYGTRFGYAPFKNYVYDRIRVLDSLTIAHLVRGNSVDLLDWFETQAVTVCGKYPLLLLNYIASVAHWDVIAETIAYATSTDGLSAQEKEQSTSLVTYAGVIVRTVPLEHRFTDFEKEALLACAWRTLKNIFDPEYTKQFIAPVYSYSLQRKDVGCFVTIYKKNEQGHKTLRGCIGTIEPGVEIATQVEKMTRAAATQDTRFLPVKKEELPFLDIEISIVNAPVPVIDYKDIKLGIHGIMIQLKEYSAVYLPEVPVQQGWSVPVTLQELCKKAGLKKEMWNHPQLKIFVFTTEKIVQKK